MGVDAVSHVGKIHESSFQIYCFHKFIANEVKQDSTNSKASTKPAKPFEMQNEQKMVSNNAKPNFGALCLFAIMS